MERQTLPRVWKFPLLTRVGLAGSLLFFGAIVLAGLFAMLTDSSIAMNSFEMFIMVGVTVVLVGLSVVLLLAPTNTLVADNEGVVPLFLPKQYQARIRWDEIVDIKVVEHNSYRYRGKALAFYLTQDRSFGPLFSGSAHAMSASEPGRAFSDGGAGSLYVPGLRLNEKAEVVRDTLLAIRNQQLHHA